MPATAVVAASRIYETAPQGHERQPEFLNQVVCLETGLLPHDLLAECQRIENEHGRERGLRFGPRTLDIDILLYQDVESEEPELMLPHPRMLRRAFVLVPLAEIWSCARGMPDLRHHRPRASDGSRPGHTALRRPGGVSSDQRPRCSGAHEQARAAGASRRLRRPAVSRPYIASRSGEPLHRRTFDVLVLGGGIAGLTAAIAAARRWRVGLLTKSTFDDTTTFLAQGGIAAALGPSDSPELHFQDTVNAGAGLCDEEAVRVLVNEGPERVRELMDICPRFDKVDGQIVLGREGAHSVARVVHAGGDATGSEVSSALAEAARVGSRVQLYENEFVIDLLTVDGRCVGALSLNLDDGGLTLNVAMVTVLATGGAGQVYGRTTNPPVATGDGIAMAYRAGAAIRDLEFVQFHPTGLAVPGQETGAARSPRRCAAKARTCATRRESAS